MISSKEVVLQEILLATDSTATEKTQRDIELAKLEALLDIRDILRLLTETHGGTIQ